MCALEAIKKGSGTLLGNPGKWKDHKFDRSTTKDRAMLQYFDISETTSGQRVEVEISCGGFTSLCPVTGQPYSGEINVSYSPGGRCVETQSLRLYLNGFRNAGWFHEECCKIVCTDLVILLQPVWLVVEGKFRSRGDTTVQPRTIYRKSEGFKGGSKVDVS